MYIRALCVAARTFSKESSVSRCNLMEGGGHARRLETFVNNTG